MICRASAGAAAPPLGSSLPVEAGLTGESIRTRQILRCDDAEQDARVNLESCRALGISSLMVVPLVRGEEVLGVFELLAERPSAFEDRDVAALQRLSEMVLTALDHADAASHEWEAESAKREELSANETAMVTATEPSAAAVSEIPAASEPEVASAPPDEPITPKPSAEILKIRTCQSCGFPVSQGRALCLDCEKAGVQVKNAAPVEKADSPALFSEFSKPQERSWLGSHIYTIGVIVVVALTVVLLVLKLR